MCFHINYLSNKRCGCNFKSGIVELILWIDILGSVDQDFRRHRASQGPNKLRLMSSCLWFTHSSSILFTYIGSTTIYYNIHCHQWKYKSVFTSYFFYSTPNSIHATCSQTSWIHCYLASILIDSDLQLTLHVYLYIVEYFSIQRYTDIHVV